MKKVGDFRLGNFLGTGIGTVRDPNISESALQALMWSVVREENGVGDDNLNDHWQLLRVSY
jgi:hypothetical protein